MRKIVFTLIVVILFASCEQLMPSSQLIRTPTLQLNSLSDISNYVRNNITYVADEGDRWQAPQETIDKGTGDCEDYCLFAGYYADKLGYNVHLVGIRSSKGDHMILELDGVYYEAQTMQRFQHIERYSRVFRESLENSLKRCWIVYKSRSVS